MKLFKSKDNPHVRIETTLSDGTNYLTFLHEEALKELVNKMLGSQVFDALCEIQKLAWRDDDCMTQDTLFQLQDKLQDLTLNVAGKVSPKAVDKLLAEFPWLYHVEEEGEK